MRRLLSFIPKLWGNWLSLLGTTLATISGNVILIVAVVDLVTGGANQYAATFGFLLMPPVFVLGLLLIAYGVWRDRRRKRVPADDALHQAMNIVLTDRSARRRVIFVVLATLVNITLISVAAFKGIQYMDSPRFCGQLCHTIMNPEYQAYLRSPHARVRCIDCHIGDGATWFFKAKLSGLRQVWGALTHRFSRPIPVPVHGLRPARETCEKCHWPDKFHGERLLVRHVYTSDQANTRLTNVVRLNVGGVNRRTGRFEGIHWHVGPTVKVEYEALDAKRTQIGAVTLIDGSKRTVYAPAGKDKARAHERRTMDCVDCHNRPTHVYDPSPERAVDQALTYGKIDAALPGVRQQAVALLRQQVERPSEAGARFAAVLGAFYAKRLPAIARTKRAAIEKAGRELGWIYERNVFPKMEISWGTYPSHLGHRQTQEGCFRCHDDEHKAKDGRVIRKDCDVCHEVEAEESEKPDVPEAVLRLGHL
jgi:hypothetical protein